MFAMSLMLQQGRGFTAFASSLSFLPLTGAVVVSNLSIAKLSERFGVIRVLAIAQVLSVVAVFGLLLGNNLISGFGKCLVAAAVAGILALALTPGVRAKRG